MFTESEKKIAFEIEPILKENMDELDGIAFEEFCAKLLRGLGYINIELTSKTGDYGIDILAEKDELIYGFQCKCYSSNIGVKAVQEVSSGAIYYNCDRAIVITNNFFTPAAINMAKRIGVILWNRHELEEKLEELLYLTIVKVESDKKLQKIKQQYDEELKKKKIVEIINILKKVSYQKEQEEIEKEYERKIKEEEWHKLREKREQEKTLVVQRKKRKKYMAIKVSVIFIAVVAIITMAKCLSNKLKIKQLNRIVYSVADEFDFKVKEIDIKKEKWFDNYYIYTLNMQTSGVKNFEIDKLYNMGEKIKNGAKEKISDGTVDICVEEDDTYTFPNKQVCKNETIIYDLEEIERKEHEEELKNEYGDKYPMVGMREEALPFTILGKPHKIIPCTDFYHLQPRAQYKDYYWGEPFKPGDYHVQVWYRRYRSNRYDDYVEYPSDNGYVFSVTYVDEYGRSHTIDDLD